MARKRKRNLNVPSKFKPEYREFERWLVEKNDEKWDFVSNNFGFWCAAQVEAGLDLAQLGFDDDFIARLRTANNPAATVAPVFSAVQFLSAATGIDLNHLKSSLEILIGQPSYRKLTAYQKRGSYLSNAELYRCIKACRAWFGYDEPGAKVAGDIVRALFEEMNLRGISKDELAKRSAVSEKTLDTWNHAQEEKRSPPTLTKIAGALEGMGLRLIVVPEADIVQVRALLHERSPRSRGRNGEE